MSSNLVLTHILYSFTGGFLSSKTPLGLCRGSNKTDWYKTETQEDLASGMPALGMVYTNRGSLLTASQGEPGGRDLGGGALRSGPRSPGGSTGRAGPASSAGPRIPLARLQRSSCGREGGFRRLREGPRRRVRGAASPGCRVCRFPGQDEDEMEGQRRREWQPTPDLLPGGSHGRRSLAGRGPWGRRESDTTEVTKHARRRLTETKPWLPVPASHSAFVSIAVWATPDYSLAASAETSPSNTGLLSLFC